MFDLLVEPVEPQGVSGFYGKYQVGEGDGEERGINTTAIFYVNA